MWSWVVAYEIIPSALRPSVGYIIISIKGHELANYFSDAVLPSVISSRFCISCSVVLGSVMTNAISYSIRNIFRCFI